MLTSELLKELGHKGISVSHYCFDRAKFSLLFDLARARHKDWADKNLRNRGPNVDRTAGLRDWVVGTGCSLHDASKALEWATRPHLVVGADILTELHIVCASLRNGYELMVDAMPQFLKMHLVHKSVPYDEDAVAEYWRMVGASQDWVPVLTKLNLWWYNGQLQVSTMYDGKPTPISLVADAVMYVMRFVSFTQTRWMTVGSSCRGLLGAMTVGVEALAKLALELKVGYGFCTVHSNESIVFVGRSI